MLLDSIILMIVPALIKDGVTEGFLNPTGRPSASVGFDWSISGYGRCRCIRASRQTGGTALCVTDPCNPPGSLSVSGSIAHEHTGKVLYKHTGAMCTPQVQYVSYRKLYLHIMVLVWYADGITDTPRDFFPQLSGGRKIFHQG